MNADTISAQIAAFSAARHDADGESPEKCSVIQSLEDNSSDPRVVSFLLDVISDPNGYDLARIEALKIFQLLVPSDAVTNDRIGRCIATLVKAERDVLVRQWSAIAAENFVSVDEVVAAISSTLMDQDADLDVRHNCLAAVMRLVNSEQVARILRSVEYDPRLGVSVRRILDERGQ